MKQHIAYDSALDDDEWREMNFSEQDRINAANCGGSQPTAEALIKAAQKYGPEGILESAIGLSQFQFKKVQRAVAALPKGKKR